MNDEECIKEIATGGSGGDRAVGLLFERYYKKFMSYLLIRQVSRPDAEDLVQDVFIKVVSSLRGTDIDVSSGRAYLYRALHNRFVDHIRAKRPEVRASELTEDRGADADSIIERIASSLNIETDELGFLHCFQKALGRFSSADDDAGAAIQMCVEGFSGAEMSEVLGRTEGATREFLRQCRMKFQRLLQDLCFDYLPERLRAG